MILATQTTSKAPIIH